ncbi:hypothetical protein YC2023_117007 [Brassica napus]
MNDNYACHDSLQTLCQVNDSRTRHDSLKLLGNIPPLCSSPYSRPNSDATLSETWRRRKSPNECIVKERERVQAAMSTKYTSRWEKFKQYMTEHEVVNKLPELKLCREADCQGIESFS